VGIAKNLGISWHCPPVIIIKNIDILGAIAAKYKQKFIGAGTS
jgi:hypothetical protein